MLIDPAIQPDREKEFIGCLLRAAHHAGKCFDETALVNFYVALKSKPMVILSGPEGSGKIAAVQCLSRFLLGDCLQCQMIAGHPWNFAKSENLALFTQIHTRYTTQKLLSLIEEAWRPENKRRAFIACLTRISPAELLSFFTEVAVQIRHDELVRLGEIHFSIPVPFPPNLFLIGTMDTISFKWWDRDLLSKTTIIQWPKDNVTVCPQPGCLIPYWESEFLRSRVRQKQTVYRKVYSILKRQQQPLLPLMQVRELLGEHAVPYLHRMIDEAMTYLANSWSRLDTGLFNPSLENNLAIALDLLISQVLLPGAAEEIQQREDLHGRLYGALIGRFPRSAAFVSSLAE